MNINATLFGQMITFALFVWFTMKLVWPPIIKALDERQTKIADGLAAAERGQRDLELAQQRSAEQLKEAKIQSAQIIDNANKSGVELVEDAKRQAREEGKRLLDLARVEIENERNSARTLLTKEVALLAIRSAEKILGREVSDITNKKIVDDVINEL